MPLTTRHGLATALALALCAGACHAPPPALVEAAPAPPPVRHAALRAVRPRHACSGPELSAARKEALFKQFAAEHGGPSAAVRGSAGAVRGPDEAVASKVSSVPAARPPLPAALAACRQASR